MFALMPPYGPSSSVSIRSINNVIRSLLFQASNPLFPLTTGLKVSTLPPTSSTVFQATRFLPPSLTRSFSASHLPMIICVSLVVLVMPISPPPLLTSLPLATRCVFLSYSSGHKGYHYINLSSNCIISQHVIFDEATFPFAASHGLTNTDFLFEMGSTALSIGIPLPPAGSPGAPHIGWVLSLVPLPAPHVPSGFLPQAAPTLSHMPFVPRTASMMPPAPCTVLPTTPMTTHVPHVASPPTSVPPTVSTARRRHLSHAWPRRRHPTASLSPLRSTSVTRGLLLRPLRPSMAGALAHSSIWSRSLGQLATHPMVTRRTSGTIKPVNYSVAFIASSAMSPVPPSNHRALADPHWRRAMEEYAALLANDTWDLVPSPPGSNVVTGKWVSNTSFRPTRHWSDKRHV